MRRTSRRILLLPLLRSSMDVLSGDPFRTLVLAALVVIGFAAAWQCFYPPSIVGKSRTLSNGKINTRIHGKLYDLSSFQHPGGPVALSLVQGRDGTALFESHHPFIPRKKLLQILSKYEVPSTEDSVSFIATLDELNGECPYDWKDIENDDFVSDLRALVIEHFSPLAKERGVSLVESSKATPQRWMVVLLLLASFFLSIPLYLSGSWTFVVVTPILAWLAVVNYWHDATHFALSSNWILNAALPYLLPLLSSPSMWYHHHVIGHHAYTNISKRDPDLAHAPQLMREHESIKWRPSHLNQTQLSRILFIWSIAVGIGLNLLNDVRALTKLSYNNVVRVEKMSSSRTLLHFLGRMLHIFVTTLWPFLAFPVWKAIVWATVPNAILSLCFMLNTQINHLTNTCAHASDNNFYKHQVVTAQNFGRSSAFCFIFSGGLNYQIEHHLLPTVNHCHLPALAPDVERLCKKHGVTYNYVEGYREAIIAHFAHTKDMSTKPTD